MTESPPTLTTEEKRQALDLVLHSQTFNRADQLKNFLRYVCEMEMAGRGGEINEYVIGVEALGRPSSYSPGDDSVVRNRAYALRHKLQDFYNHELPHAPVRIELPKGSYCPHFVRADGGAPAEAGERAAEAATAHPPLAETQPRPRRPAGGLKGLALSFLAGVLLTAVVALLIRFAARPQPNQTESARLSPVVREVWGPLLERDANVLVCVATPVQLFVRQYRGDTPPDTLLPNPPEQLYDFFRQRHQLQSEGRLYLLPTHNSPLWGDAAGAMAVTQTLAAAGASFQTLPERVVSFPALRGRNVILLGAPEYSPAAARLLRQGAFNISYLPSAHDHAIINQQPDQAGSGAGGSPYIIKRESGGSVPEEVYGLITVLPSEGADDGTRRTVVLSGLTSAGMQAAAEFFASPAGLLEFQNRLKAAGQATIPRAYQIVIKVNSNSILPLSFRYEAHRILLD
jgi:hypothetical protein